MKLDYFLNIGTSPATITKTGPKRRPAQTNGAIIPRTINMIFLLR
ncbi:MAG: hypothetical protein RTS72_00195 [Candidatus Thorarchaeota archaeon]